MFRSGSVISRRIFAFSTSLATWLVNDFLGPLYGGLPQAYGMHTRKWWAQIPQYILQFWHCSKLRDSIIGANTSTLDDFVISISNCFTLWMSLGHAFVVHVALLVHASSSNATIKFWQFIALLCHRAPTNPGPSCWRRWPWWRTSQWCEPECKHPTRLPSRNGGWLMTIQCLVKHVLWQEVQASQYTNGHAPTQGDWLLVNGWEVVCCLHAARPTWNFMDYAWMDKVCAHS